MPWKYYYFRKHQQFFSDIQNSSKKTPRRRGSCDCTQGDLERKAVQLSEV